MVSSAAERKPPYLEGQPVRVVIRKTTADCWYATVGNKVVHEELVANGVVAGIDMNVGQVAAALSTNTTRLLEQPKDAILDIKVKWNHRAMSRKKKGSSRHQ